MILIIVILALGHHSPGVSQARSKTNAQVSTDFAYPESPTTTELASLGFETNPRSEGYFEAEMEVRTILYRGGSSTDESYAYKIYQNLDNIVRREVVSAPPSDVAGEGRDVHIIDYENNTLISYDKGKNTAVRKRLFDAETLMPSPSATTC